MTSQGAANGHTLRPMVKMSAKIDAYILFIWFKDVESLFRFLVWWTCVVEIIFNAVFQKVIEFICKNEWYFDVLLIIR